LVSLKIIAVGQLVCTMKVCFYAFRWCCIVGKYGVLTKFLSNVFYSLSQQLRFTMCIYSLCDLVKLCHLARLYNISDLFYTFSIALDFLYKNHNTTL